MYRIYAFDGLALPEYVDDGGVDNLGTGAALTSFIQLPGGYYDNYGNNRAPQGIRPITKTCVLYGSTQETLKNNLDALRAKLGKRGKLSVLFDDGSMRWQWARLTNIDTPRTVDAMTKWLPCSLTWVTADQIWFKVIVSAEEWTWGDGTWTFGDGTAEIGESGTSATLTSTSSSLQSFTINHGGNIDATNVAVRITAGTSGITSWGYINYTRNEFMADDTVLAAGESITVNGGDRSAWIRAVPVDISAIYNVGSAGETICVCSSAHGLTTGDTVEISGSAYQDGVYRNVTVTSSTNFKFASTRYSISDGAGTVTQLSSAYGSITAFKSKWPVLSPGDNSIAVYVVGNAAQDSTISWEYYEHLA